MISRLLHCDEPNCSSTFNGSRSAAYRAGWANVAKGRKKDRCPACRKRIVTHERKINLSLERPVMPARRNGKYGASAYGYGMTPERLAEAMGVSE